MFCDKSLFPTWNVFLGPGFMGFNSSAQIIYQIDGNDRVRDCYKALLGDRYTVREATVNNVVTVEEFNRLWVNRVAD